jgi:DNA-binding GntR family transcriptional regulator
MLEAMKRKNARSAERLVRNHLIKGKEIIIKEINRGGMAP